MIQDGYITYPGASSIFRNWQPQNPFLFEISFAALTTCLVYLTTKIVLDIGLGRKKRGEIAAPDIVLFMLVSNLSLRATISSLGCKGHIATRRFHGRNGVCTARKDPNGKFNIPFAIKGAILILAAPTIHSIGIFFSLERQKIVRFKDVNFGGATLGISKEEVRSDLKVYNCQRLLTKFSRSDSDLATFFRCLIDAEFDHEENKPHLGNNSFIVIIRTSDVDIGLTLFTPGKRWISAVQVAVLVEGTLGSPRGNNTSYHFRSSITEKQIDEIAEPTIQRMMSSCRSVSRTVPPDEVMNEFIPPGHSQRLFGYQVECERDLTNFTDPHVQELLDIANTTLTSVTLIDADTFDLLEVQPEKTQSQTLENPNFIQGHDLVLLHSQGTTLSFLTILIAFLASLCVRVVIGLVTNNDAHLAVEAVVKDQLSLKCCDSMLQVETRVHYDQAIEVEDDKYLEKIRFEEANDSIQGESSGSSEDGP